MILTPDLAEDKLCPVLTKADDEVRCISESCMAWRWYEWVDKEEVHKGYCGLAGKP